PLHRRNRGGGDEFAERAQGADVTPAPAPLVLASGSASRKALLAAAGVDYSADPADLDEKALMAQLRAEGANAERIAEELAAQKALHVSRRHPGALVLGGDSVIAFGDRLLSK